MTIKEVSVKFNLTQDTLRYYERIGLIFPVGRNRNGIRNYTEDDCTRIGFIKCMREAGLPIEVLLEYVTLLQQGDTTVEARKELLIEQRKQLIGRLETMQNTLEKLNYKIEIYDQIVKREKEFRKNTKA